MQSVRRLEGILSGCPAWTRTKNNASKGRCVTVTPQGKEPAKIQSLSLVANGSAPGFVRNYLLGVQLGSGNVNVADGDAVPAGEDVDVSDGETIGVGVGDGGIIFSQ